jgi:hypothetical protein
MLGPVAGNINSLGQATIGNYRKGLEDDSYDSMEGFLSDTFRMVKRHIPAGTLWYSRLAMERSLLDGMNRMVDPRWDEKQQAAARRLYNDSQQEYYWSP